MTDLPKSFARQIRFQAHPTKTACWIWQGHMPDEARRIAYSHLVGSPPANLTPQCEQRLCVNPHHTEKIEKQSVV